MDVAPPAARVLVVLGNSALHGQERGNIEGYRALQADGVEALFVTHARWGANEIEPFLARLGLPELVTAPGLDGVVCEAPTAEALAVGIEHYLSLSEDALAAAGEAARASLARLGSDEATFRARWFDALGARPAPPAPEPPLGRATA